MNTVGIAKKSCRKQNFYFANWVVVTPGTLSKGNIDELWQVEFMSLLVMNCSSPNSHLIYQIRSMKRHRIHVRWVRAGDTRMVLALSCAPAFFKFKASKSPLHIHCFPWTVRAKTVMTSERYLNRFSASFRAPKRMQHLTPEASVIKPSSTLEFIESILYL